MGTDISVRMFACFLPNIERNCWAKESNLMEGKVRIITGATDGIGKCTAMELARRGGTVIIVGRDSQKCIQTTDEIRNASNNPEIDYIVADLSSQKDIRRMVAEFREKYQRLDVLVNNVGAAFIQRQLSVDGIEKTFALNHLSYFLITNLLLDMLILSAPARIVNVSSGSHFGKRLDFDNLQLHKGYKSPEAYSRAKLANILFTYELDRRLKGSGVTTTAMNPGRVATKIWKDVGSVIGPLMTWFMARTAQSPEEGAQGVIFLASSPDVEGVSGKYFRKKVEMESDPETYDPDVARRLWEISEKMTGLDKVN
jgi:NAD(P)-dependent dehydrogenase (short-subunit alcohol dehydrogenase family)